MDLASCLSQLAFHLPLVCDTLEAVVATSEALCYSACSIATRPLLIYNLAWAFGSRGPYISKSDSGCQEPAKSPRLQLYNKFWLCTNPPPRPALRERSLTSPATEETEQQTFDQAGSSLLQLPGEIRMMIYREVLAGKNIHITHFDRRLGHIKSTQHGDKEIDVKEFWRQECIEYQYWDEVSEDVPTCLDARHRSDRQQQPSRGFTSILKTCCKVYAIQPSIVQLETIARLTSV